MIDRMHPLTLFIFFLFAAALPAFSGNPVFFCLSFTAALIMKFTYCSLREILKKIPGYLIFFILVAIINPLFYHDGNTVLFYINGLRITLESLLYGVCSSVMITGTLLWCSSLTHYMTDEKMLYLFGRFSPKVAIILSMAMRFIPMYGRELASYRRTQKLLGIYGSGSLLEKMHGEALIFGGFLTRILEHSMTTADSMTARGYGTGKLKIYGLFRLKISDVLLLIIIVVFAVPLIIFLALGCAETSFYPSVIMPENTPQYLFTLILYSALAFIPSACEYAFKARLKLFSPQNTAKNISD